MRLYSVATTDSLTQQSKIAELTQIFQQDRRNRI